MSKENDKVCCNCRHNIRTGEIEKRECHCDIDNHYIGYTECMTGWCRYDIIHKHTGVGDDNADSN